MRMARVVGGVGRALVTAGVLLLLFVAYQLWGTGLREAQSQARLDDEFAEMLEEAGDGPAPSATTSTSEGGPSTGSSTSTTSTTAPEVVPPIEPVPQGSAVAQIRIPRIGVDKTVVEGVSLADLKKGPGHYPESPLPGQEGNAAIAGHRTTYGAPFARVDELEPGDEIFVRTVQGEFRYVVSGQQIVSPEQVEVLDDMGDDRLTLTACHPKYSASERIVIVALLDPEQEALPRPPREVEELPAPASPIGVDDLDGAGAPVWPAVALAGLCAAIWLLAWLLGRLWRPWPTYAVALPFFLVSLYFCFEGLSSFLPSSY